MGEQLPTLTLAELYSRQGLHGRARDIYQQLARSDSHELRAEAEKRLVALGPSAREEIELLRELMARVQERRRRVWRGP